MIGEFILNIVFNIIIGMFEVLPDFSWNFDLSTLSPLINILKAILYFFPLPIVYLIFTFYIWKTNFKIAVATARTLWEILPLV